MQALEELQSILSEFYAQSSPPDRLISIQKFLIEFEQNPTSLKMAMDFLAVSSDNYICMFSLGVIEISIKRWTHLSDVEKQTIIEVLEKYAFYPNTTLSTSLVSTSFTKSKAIQIWTKIHKLQFPQMCDSFFEKVLYFLKSPISARSLEDMQRITFGLHIFKSAYEELLKNDNDISIQKSSQIHSIAGNFAPQVLNVLLNIAEKLLGCDVINAVKPLFLCDTVSEADFYDSLKYILVVNLNIMYASDSENVQLSPVIVNIFGKLLTCLSAFLATTPIGVIDHCRLYSFIYIFSVMGLPSSILAVFNVTKSNSISPTLPMETFAEIGLQSLTCLQEIVERKDLPKESMLFHLLHIFRIIYWSLLMQDEQYPLPAITSSCVILLTQSGVQFISKLTDESSLSELASVTQAFQTVSQDSFQKLADLLKLLITNFLFFFRKYDELAAAPTPYTFTPSIFLKRVHYFTFNICRSIFPVYLTCLELWEAYLVFTKAVYFGESATIMPTTTNSFFCKFTQPVISILCSSLVSSIFFSDSASYLDSLDKDTSDFDEAVVKSNSSYVDYFNENVLNSSFDSFENIESEYGQFMQASLVLLSSVAFFKPKTVLHTISSRLQEGMDVCSEISNSGDRLILEDHTSRKLHVTLRDLATSLRCLTYIAEHFVSLKDPNVIRWLLQSLVFNLEVGVSLCDRVTYVREETIKQDIIQVISKNIGLLRCVLTSGLIVCIESKNLPEVDQSVLILSLTEKDSLVLRILQCIHHILLSSKTVHLQTSQLFLSLITSANPPGFLPSINLLNENSSSMCLQQLIDSCCSAPRLKLFSITVQRVLMRAITVYLLTDEVSSSLQRSVDAGSKKRLEQLQLGSKTKLIILNKGIISLFSRVLQPNTLKENRDDYFAGLCWFNEALASLNTLGSKSRNIFYDCLVSSGLLDRLWQCLDASFSNIRASEVDSALFVAHLSFFVQFNNIYGSNKAAASLIPGFVTAVLKLLQSLEQTAALSSQLISPIIVHLVSLLTVLIANRNTFVPIANDVLIFSINCLLLNLASPINAVDISSQNDIVNVVNLASRNDPDLTLALFGLLFRIVSFGFSQLGQNPNDLTTFLLCVLSVFYGGVVDPRLIVCCMQGLEELNQQHRLFTLSFFETTWRDQLAKCILNLLFSQPQSDADEVLIQGVYTLYVTPGETKNKFQVQTFLNSAFLPFMTTTCIQITEKTDFCAELVTAFNSTDNEKLHNAGEFAKLLGPCMANLKSWSKSNRVPSIFSRSSRLANCLATKIVEITPTHDSF